MRRLLIALAVGSLPISVALADTPPEGDKALVQVAEADTGASKTWNAAEARKAAAKPAVKKADKATAKSGAAKPSKAAKKKKKKKKAKKAKKR